jgi:hypothetical protein
VAGPGTLGPDSPAAHLTPVRLCPPKHGLHVTVELGACDTHDTARLASVLADLPVHLLGRLRADRVLRLPEPLRPPAATGCPTKHGPEFRLDTPATWPTPQHQTITATTRYDAAQAASWDRLHPRLTRRTCWIDHDGAYQSSKAP